MPGGNKNINAYNNSISAEERKQNARRAGAAPKKPKPKVTLIRDITKKILDAPAPDSLKETLAEFGLDDEDMTIAAGVSFAVVRAALEGDLKAVEKVERYTGQYINEREELENAVLKAKAKAMDDSRDKAEPIRVIISPPDNNDGH